MIHPAHLAQDAQRLPLAERIAVPIARFMGTGRFLVIQTAAILAWCGLNAAAWAGRWDPYPFILLNLAFSTQAAYAAPLILLAANRQTQLDRDRADIDHQASQENLHLTRGSHSLLGAIADHLGLAKED